MSHIKENIKYLRKQRGETQAQLADTINIGRTRYANYEQGVSSPGVEEIILLSNHFGITIDDLLKKNLKKLGDIREYLNAKPNFTEKTASTHYKKVVINANTEGSEADSPDTKTAFVPENVPPTVPPTTYFKQLATLFTEQIDDAGKTGNAEDMLSTITQLQGVGNSIIINELIARITRLEGLVADSTGIKKGRKAANNNPDVSDML